MNRRDFLGASAALSATALIPTRLFSEAAKERNLKNFLSTFVPKLDGDVKEFQFYSDITGSRVLRRQVRWMRG